MRSFAWLAALALLVALPASAAAYLAASGPTLAAAVSERALRFGDRGPAVAELQELLRERGFDPGPVDGIFGPLTEAAVIAAQRHYGLEVDGLAGRMTVGALGVRPQAVPPPTAPPAARAEREAQPVTASGLVVYEAASASAAADGKASGVAAAGTAGGGGAVAMPVAGARTAALTFHHLPDSESLAALLRRLEEHGARATFFVTGVEAGQRQDDLQRVRTAGHDVGSLGYRGVDMRDLPALAARLELRRSRQAIAEAVGESPVLFRPPLGRFDRELMRMAEEEGMRPVLWSNAVGPGDGGAGPERVAAQALRTLQPGAIIMVPLDAPGGVDAALRVLEGMSAAGYRTQRLIDVDSDRN